MAWCFHCRQCSFHPCLGTKIPHATWCGWKKKTLDPDLATFNYQVGSEHPQSHDKKENTKYYKTYQP